MRRLFLPLATLILLVAAFLRLWQLHTYPPGPHYDEAAYLLITRSIAFGGARPFPIVEAYQGREVLYMYLDAPLLHLLGDQIFTLHVSNAFYNLLTVAASLALGRAMFRGNRGLVIGLIVGLLMALNFPQIWLGRQAFRAVTLPMCQAFALLCLWRGLNARQNGWRWLLAGGVLAGVTLYTYMASRLFPFWLALGGLALLVADWKHRGFRLRQAIIFFGALIVVALPMVIYAIQKPDIFWGRLSEVTEADKSVTLAESIVLHARMFFIEGDPYLRYNIPGRPYLTWPEGLLMLVGIAVCAYRLLRPIRAAERAAYALALLSPLMVIPSVISVGGLPPSHMRSLGMIPLIFVLVAVGAEWLFSKFTLLLNTYKTRMSVLSGKQPESDQDDSVGAGLVPPARSVLTQLPYDAPKRPDFFASQPPIQRRLALDSPSPHVERGLGGEASKFPTRIFSVLLLFILFVGGFLVAQTYFAWAGRADLYYESDADLAAAARWLQSNTYVDDVIYVAAKDRGHPTVMIAQTPPITWLGTDSLFRAPQGKAGLYIFPRSAPPPDEWLAWLEQGRLNDLPLGPDGRTAFEAFRLSSDVPLPPSDWTPDAPVENSYVSLAGSHASPIAAGGHGDFVMEWSILSPPPESDFTPLVQLEDEVGTVLSRSDIYITETDRWRAGEVLMQRVRLDVPAGTPPGLYPVRVAWIAKGTDTYVPYLSGSVWMQIGQVEVTRPQQPPDPSALSIAVRDETDLAPGVRLLGWNQPPDAARPGENISLALFWQAVESPAPRQELTLGFLLEDGQQTTLDERQPLQNLFPVSAWQDGEVLEEHLRFTIPRDQAAGHYTLTLRTDDIEKVLGEIEIAGLPRVFDPPTMTHATNILFGDVIALRGYDLEAGQGSLTVRFLWQAARLPDRDYTVFIHVLDSAGNIVAQQDTAPQQNQYPTSLWLEGEYVLDEHILNGLPAGDYQVIAGLYSQETGQRLNKSGGGMGLPESFIILGRIRL